MTATTTSSEPALRPLRRNLQFQLLWAGQSTASLGLEVASVAYPLAIVTLTGSAGQAGLFAAVQTVGTLVAGLPSGHLADRYDRRMVVIVVQSCRALVTVIVVAGLLASWLSLALLLAAAALLGAGQAAASAAQLPLVRSVVPPEQLTTALVQDELRVNGAALAGPPLAGLLFGIRHAAPFIFTAITFMAAALAAVAFRALPGRAAAPARPADNRESASSGSMLAGFRWMWAAPVLRAALILCMAVNTVGAGVQLIIIVLLHRQHTSPGLIGVVLAAAAVGGLAGATLVRPLHRIPPGILLLSACLLDIPLMALLAVPYGPWWLASLLFTSALIIPSLRVLIDVLVFRQVPDELRGRTVAALTTAIAVGMPVGLAGTGLLLQWLPARTAVLVLAALEAIGVLFCALRKELWRARWPQ
jgi:MFS family permease